MFANSLIGVARTLTAYFEREQAKTIRQTVKIIEK